MSPTHTSVVFDVGNVLFGYNPSAIVDRILGPTPFKDDFLNHLFLSPAWQAMDRGDLTVEQLVASLRNDAAISSDALQSIPVLVAEFTDHLDPIHDMIALFGEVSDRMPTYILSNFQDRPFDRLESTHSFFAKAAGKVVSAKVNMMKPEPDIYRYLLDTFSLDPGRTIFIDDLEDNIKAAEAFGITGILYRSPQQVRETLRQLGVVT